MNSPDLKGSSNSSGLFIVKKTLKKLFTTDGEGEAGIGEEAFCIFCASMADGRGLTN
jgi:hypothetical protein